MPVEIMFVTAAKKLEVVEFVIGGIVIHVVHDFKKGVSSRDKPPQQQVGDPERIRDDP